MIVAPPPRPDLEDEFWSRFNAWQFVQADPPEAGQKPDWKAVKNYPVAQRAANRGKLIAVRPKTYTNVLVVDLDARSRYHPVQNPYAIVELQHALETRLGLAECIVLRSSDNGGIHLWYWFEEEHNAYHLAEAVAIVAKDAGFVPQPGHLEFFPNCKTWIDSDCPQDWSQYQAIRIPFQEPGSYLLDSRNGYRRLLHTFADQRQEFLRLVTYCQQRNDLTRDRIEAILATKPKQFKKVSVGGNKYLNDLLDKVRYGWTSHGQTNQLLFDVTRLLRVFGHFLLGAAPFWESDRLAKAIHEYILQLPGREQFCGHNHELEKIAWEWATWVQNTKYKPYGYGNKTLEEETTVDSAELTHNQRLQQSARERIIIAIAQLLEQGTFPSPINERIKALEALGIKRGTLYRHRDLWHPDNLSDAPESTPRGEFTPDQETESPQTELDPNENKEFTPIPYKELSSSRAVAPQQARETFKADLAVPGLAVQPTLFQLETQHAVETTRQALENQKQTLKAAKQAAKREQMQKWLDSGDRILEAEAKTWFAQQIELFEDVPDSCGFEASVSPNVIRAKPKSEMT